MSTLGKFIQDEIRRRNLSSREFAKLVGVSHMTISKYSLYGIEKEYGGRTIGEPPNSFLAKLAIATSTDLCALVALIHPEATHTNAERQIISDQINALPPDLKDQAVIFILGLLAKRLEKDDKDS